MAIPVMVSTTVVSLSAPDETLSREISSLQRRAPRLTVRLPVRVHSEDSAAAFKAMGQTENVSTGGMLIRARRRQFPVNTLLRFELDLPDDPDPVSGRGLVVRHTQEDRDGIRGVGIQFMDFEDDGRVSLLEYIDRASASEGT